ncbi:MAG: DNA-directed RNA polymerase subunit omega [Eubacteriales bacterium]|nr:DNA-directed RNA polymerase subunit omega [Eubacteriales bacterium]
MIHPSYVDLMEVVNKDVEEGETPVINSRYSIVMATAKRARQIVDGDEPLVKVSRGEKPLSIAVDELNQAEIRILAEDEVEEEYLIESETAAEELSEADEVQTEDTDASDAAQDSDAEDTENTLDEITAEETAGTAAEEIAADEEEIAAAEEAEDVAE